MQLLAGRADFAAARQQQITEQQRQDYVVALLALAPAEVCTVRSIAERLGMGRSVRPVVRANEFVLRLAHDFAENGTLVSPHLSDMQTEYWGPESTSSVQDALA